MLLIEPALVGATSMLPVPVGLICTWPVPVGEMSTCALLPLMLVLTDTAKLSPPPAPHDACVVPLAFRNAPPAEFTAWNTALLILAPVTLPVAETTPPVSKLPVVMLPVVVMVLLPNPLPRKLLTLALPYAPTMLAALISVSPEPLPKK